MPRSQARHVVFVASKVRERRLALQLTNEQLARNVDVSLRTVQRWQDGLNAPQGAQLLRLAQALGVDPGDLYFEQLPAA